MRLTLAAFAAVSLVAALSAPTALAQERDEVRPVRRALTS
jgi:hypothetical protein